MDDNIPYPPAALWNPHQAGAPMGPPPFNTRAECHEWISENPQPALDQIDFMMQFVFDELGDMFDVTRLSRRQQYAVLRQGVTFPIDLRIIGRSLKTAIQTFSPFNSMTVTRGYTNFGAGHYKAVYAMVMWAHECHMLDIEADSDNFTDAIYQQLLERINDGVVKIDADSEDSEIADPPKLEDHTYRPWYIRLMTKLRSRIGRQGIPMDYIDKDPKPDGYEYADDAERIRHTARRRGGAYQEDNRWVANYLVSQLMGTVGEAWIKDFVEAEDGRAMLLALNQHFMSQGHIRTILKQARATRNAAVFKNQQTYSFQKVCSDLKGVYDIYEQLADHPISEEDKLNDLREKIQTSNTEFNSVVQGALSLPENQTFVAAIGAIDGFVGQYFPPKATSNFPRARVASVAANLADDSRDGKHFHNGVDITDLTRTYSKGDWARLSKEVQGAIIEAKNAKRQQLGGPKNNKRTGRNLDKKYKKSVKKLTAKVSALTKQLESQGAEVEKGESLDDSGDKMEVGPASYNKAKKKKKS